MVSSRLPAKPDFDAIAASAPSTADRRTLILALIGNLVSSWSNNESLFIYVLMILMRTDQEFGRPDFCDAQYDAGASRFDTTPRQDHDQGQGPRPGPIEDHRTVQRIDGGTQ